MKTGTYIVAVSGGIDSVVLLDMLAHESGHTLIVAHFDHGIRDDSVEDADFVRGLAGTYGLVFESQREELGTDASEQLARTRRYAFLKEVQLRHKADAIVTAHHQDDRIETAAINTLRGTKRRGLVSLRSTKERVRPLLGMTKQDIREYAVSHRLEFREDSTNASMDYLRNRVRARLYARLAEPNRQNLLKLLDGIELRNAEIDSLVSDYLAGRESTLPRIDFVVIDALALYEIIAQWLRNHNAVFDKNTIVRICNGARKLDNGAKIDVDKHYYCQVRRNEIILTRR